MIDKIIPAITPDNITDIQLLKDALDLFLDYILEYSDITVDIKNIFSDKKVPIYEEFVQIYLKNVHSVLTKSEHNEALYIKLKTLYETMGYNIDDLDLSVDVVDLLKKDYILTNKDFKASKGTPKGMEYIYNIIIQSGIQADFLEDNEGQFNYYESGRKFEYCIEGTMVTELYEHFVKPLTHPVGWAYFYQRLFYMSFVDYFNLEFVYTINQMEVRCMNGDMFQYDDYKTNISHDGKKLVSNHGEILVNEITTEMLDEAIISNVIDYEITGTAYGRDIYENNIASVTINGTEYTSTITFEKTFTILVPVAELILDNNIIVSVYGEDPNNEDNNIITHSSDDVIVEENISDNIVFISTEYIGSAKTKRLTVYFKSGEILVSLETPRSLILYDIDGTVKINYSDGDGNCGLYLDFDVITKTTTDDKVNFKDISSFASTTGKMNVIGAENLFVGSFVVGDILVNRDISVTYQSPVGMFDGIYNDEYIVTKEDIFWDLTNYNFDDYQFILDNNINGSGFVYLDYTDMKIDDNKFFVDMEIEAVVAEEIAPYTALVNYPRYDGTNQTRIYAIGGESGKTAADIYDAYQELVKINPAELADHYEKDTRLDINGDPVKNGTGNNSPSVTNGLEDTVGDCILTDGEPLLIKDVVNIKLDWYYNKIDGKYTRDITKRYPVTIDGITTMQLETRAIPLTKVPNEGLVDDLNNQIFWDTRNLRFDNFNFDSEYVTEEFEINYDYNVWDTDIYFNFFQLDGKYVGGGFHSY